MQETRKERTDLKYYSFLIEFSTSVLEYCNEYTGYNELTNSNLDVLVLARTFAVIGEAKMSAQTHFPAPYQTDDKLFKLGLC